MEWLFRKRMFGMLRHTIFIKWNNKILFYTYHLHQVEQRNLSDVCKKTWLKNMVQKWEKEEKEWKEWKKRKEKEKKTLFQAKKIFNPCCSWRYVYIKNKKKHHISMRKNKKIREIIPLKREKLTMEIALEETKN